MSCNLHPSSLPAGSLGCMCLPFSLLCCSEANKALLSSPLYLLMRNETSRDHLSFLL